MLPFSERVDKEQETEGNQFTLQTIRDLREFENLREIWKSWQQTRDADLDFFSAMVRSRGDRCRRHVIVLNRNSRPDALLVGLIDRTRVPINLGWMVLGRPRVNALEFVYGGLLGNASHENCVALVQAVIRSLAEGDADVAMWQQLDVHSVLYSCAFQLPSLLLRDHSPCIRDHWFMKFPKDLDDFLLRLGSRQRSQLRRKYKRVLNSLTGRIRLRGFRTVADLQHAIPEIDKIASKSIKHQMGYGFLDAPQTRERLLLEARGGWLRMYILYIEEKPVSFWQGTLHEGCLQAEHTGFDSTWRAFSPGIVLFLKILETLRDEDVTTVDFGCGNGQFYHCFGDVRRREARIQICAPRLGVLQFHLLRALTQEVTTLVRRTPPLSWARSIAWKRRQTEALTQLGLQSEDSLPRSGNPLPPHS